jgi:hypothetical protein
LLVPKLLSTVAGAGTENGDDDAALVVVGSCLTDLTGLILVTLSDDEGLLAAATFGGLVTTVICDSFDPVSDDGTLVEAFNLRLLTMVLVAATAAVTAVEVVSESMARMLDFRELFVFDNSSSFTGDVGESMTRFSTLVRERFTFDGTFRVFSDMALEVM